MLLMVFLLTAGQGPRASETRREGIKSRLGSQPRRPSPRWNSRDPPRRAPLQRVELRSREQRRVTSRKESEEAFTERKREEILGKLKQEALESRKERAKEKERRSLEDVESLVLSEKDEGWYTHCMVWIVSFQIQFPSSSGVRPRDSEAECSGRRFSPHSVYQSPSPFWWRWGFGHHDSEWGWRLGICPQW